MKWFPSTRPPTAGNWVIPYVYGRCAFEDIADALATATSPDHRIYLIGWYTIKDTPLKPGGGAANTLEAYLTSTRAQIRALFWDGWIGVTSSIGKQQHSNQWIHDLINRLPNGASVLDGKLPGLGIHHQKMVIVQGALGLIAFLGGMDLHPSRVGVNPPSEPWHDVQLRVIGPAALACRQVFQDRWRDHPDAEAGDRKLGIPPAQRANVGFPPVPAATPAVSSVTLPSGSKLAGRRRRVAVGRTFANLSKLGLTPYSFAPHGEYTAWELIEHGIRTAKRWIYVEDQYLVSRMARAALLKKLTEPGFEFLLMLMNDSAAAGADIPYLRVARNEFRRDLARIDKSMSKWGMYTLKDSRDPERRKWCGAYVHSKLWIFDDQYAIVGSANCDNRGYTYDSEVVAGIADNDAFSTALGESFAVELRTMLWHKHLGVPHAHVRDWKKGLALWRKPPPTAMIVDASALEIDPDLGAYFPSANDQPRVEFFWTRFIDPDAR